MMQKLDRFKKISHGHFLVEIEAKFWILVGMTIIMSVMWGSAITEWHLMLIIHTYLLQKHQ